MKRTNTAGTPRWVFDAGTDLHVVATHTDGDIVQAHLLPDSSDGALRLRVARYSHSFSSFGDRPPAPLAEIEQWANREGNVMLLLDMRHTIQPDAGEVVSMRLPTMLVRGRGRKPDSFYERVLALVDVCEQHGIAYGPRLAADNEVEQNTVFRWVREARRRKQAKEAGR